MSYLFLGLTLLDCWGNPLGGRCDYSRALMYLAHHWISSASECVWNLVGTQWIFPEWMIGGGWEGDGMTEWLCVPSTVYGMFCMLWSLSPLTSILPSSVFTSPSPPRQPFSSNILLFYFLDTALPWFSLYLWLLLFLCPACECWHASALGLGYTPLFQDFLPGWPHVVRTSDTGCIHWSSNLHLQP